MRLLLCIAAIAALLLSSCSDDPMGTPRTPSADYSKVTLEYFGSGANTIWGRAANDLYLGGSVFTHYDGNEWNLMEYPPGTYFYFESIGPGPDGMLNCRGGFNYLYQYDGRAWSDIDVPVFVSEYWNSDDGQIFVMDRRGHFWRFADAGWSELDSLPATNGDFYDYTAIAGDASDNIFAVAYDGSISNFDGTSWRAVKPAGGRGLRSAWKEASGPLYVTSYSDTLYTYDGSSLTAIDLGPSFRAEVVTGSPPSEVYVQGYDYASDCYVLRKRIGAQWGILDCNDSFSYSAWGAATGESFVGTSRGLLRIQGDERDVMLGIDSDDREMNGRFHDMWGTEIDGIVAVGTLARRYFGGEWTDLHKQDLTLVPAYGVWGTSIEDVWAVGPRMILHFDGDDWTWVSGANQENMSGVWSNDKEAIAVGSNGTILRYDGDEWKPMPSGTTYDLSVVWGWEGGAFAAGEAGVILRRDGYEWRIEDSPINWTIYDLFGLDANDIWAVGASTIEICHFNGREWRPVDIAPLQGDCVSVWAGSSRNVFVANSNGRVIHFDGEEWSAWPRYTEYSNCLWGVSNGDLLVGGAGIVRYQR